MAKKIEGFLNSKFGKGSAFNTNNGWGFGGGAGTCWTLGKIHVRCGTASTRHRGTFPFVTVSVEGVGRVYDESSLSIETMEKIIAKHS